MENKNKNGNSIYCVCYMLKFISINNLSSIAVLSLICYKLKTLELVKRMNLVLG